MDPVPAFGIDVLIEHQATEDLYFKLLMLGNYVYCIYRKTVFRFSVCSSLLDIIYIENKKNCTFIPTSLFHNLSLFRGF